MGSDFPVDAWTVDFDTQRAWCGAVVVSFRPCGEEGFSVTFLAGYDLSVEEQCAVAGEAIIAIRAARLIGPG